MSDQDAKAPLPKRMLIDGKLVEAERTYPTVNPATGQVFAHAPDASVADAEAAVAAARRAFDTTSWPTDVAFRARCLDQLHEALTEHKEELRELTITDVGAPRQITYGAQLDQPIEIVRYYADLLPGYPLTEEIGQIEFMRQAAPPLGGEGGGRRRRRDHRLQLPDPARPGQARPRPRGRAARSCSRPPRTRR